MNLHVEYEDLAKFTKLNKVCKPLLQSFYLITLVISFLPRKHGQKHSQGHMETSADDAVTLSRTFCCCSVSVVSHSSRPHGLQHARLPCPSPSPWACSNSCPLSQWCHPTISSSVISFFSCFQSFPASRSFPVSWLFKSGDQRTGAWSSASVLPMTIQGWFPLGLTGLISLQSKGLSRVFFLLWTSSTSTSIPVSEGSLLDLKICRPKVCVRCVHAQLLSHIWLCNSMDYSLPGSSIHGIFYWVISV